MNRPIGVIDSGLGGLTVAKEISRQLPKEQMIYIGDTARCPYGPRPIEEVRRFTWEMIAQLRKADIKMLVIACNTATAFVLEEVKEELSIPVIGVIHPGATAALKVTDRDIVAVIGTEGTINSQAYDEALRSIHPTIQVKALACPAFVPLVEKGVFAGSEALETVRNGLSSLNNLDFDTLILGCTHYPLLYDAIREAVGPDIHIISSGEETAREVSTLLYHHDLLYTEKGEPKHSFLTTGSPTHFQQIAKRWMGIDIQMVVTSVSLATSS
ncbi:glutamate racemase [Salsuginibacillus kocurii]|uniref:glutamate racemase n=1 Tax=Salsuginibacillus kocurii TaxID=427078 RepID=UPI00036B90A0|nr:glutamate racemase [Salsuginibacillus kocurii]